MQNCIVNEIKAAYKLKTSTWYRPNMAERNICGLVLFKQGKIKYFDQEKEYLGKENTILFLPKSYKYYGEKVTKTQEYYVIDFNVSNIEALKNIPNITNISNFEHYEKIFVSIINNFNNGNNFIAYSKLYLLISELEKEKISEDLPPLITPIIEYINNNITNCNMQVPDICKKFAISESQIRRYFKKYIGCSPIEYITEKRLNNACNYLKYEDITISEIADVCGFTSAYYFSRIFKNKTGLSPTKYKNKG